MHSHLAGLVRKALVCFHAHPFHIYTGSCGRLVHIGHVTSHRSHRSHGPNWCVEHHIRAPDEVLLATPRVRQLQCTPVRFHTFAEVNDHFATHCTVLLTILFGWAGVVTSSPALAMSFQVWIAESL